MNTKSALSSEAAHGKWGQAGDWLQNCTFTQNKISEVEPLGLSGPVRAKSSLVQHFCSPIQVQNGLQFPTYTAQISSFLPSLLILKLF